jgi:hypothetical protein
MGDPIAEEGSHNIAGPCSDRGQFQDDEKRLNRGGRGAGCRGTGGRGGRGLPRKRSPPPKSLKKKGKFEESSKSTSKVDMTAG